MEDFAQFALPEEERRRLLFSRLMMGLGAGLLDSRGKNVWPAISTGLLGGMQMGQQAIGNAQQGMVAQYKLKREVEQDRERKAMADAAAGLNQELGDILDRVKTDPAKAFQIYTEGANRALRANDMKRAEQLFKEAEKYRAKYSATPHTVMGPDGKPVLVQTSEYEQPREVQGYRPKPELSFQDLGGSVAAIDSLTTPPGSTFAKSLTPSDTQRQKQWEAEQQLRVRADQRAAASAGQAKEVKPQLVDGQWVYPPDAGNPGGRAVPVAGMKPKEEKLTDQQLTAAAFASRMADSSKILDALEKKFPNAGVSASYLAGAKNIPLVGGLAGPIANMTAGSISPGTQSYLQAKRAWIRAKLRKESGAVIGVEEEAQEDRTFFPQVGDSDQVKAQKAQMRKDVERSMAIQSRGMNKQDDPLGLR